MAYTPARCAAATLTTTANTIVYTSTLVKTLVKEITLCNFTGSAVTANVKLAGFNLFNGTVPANSTTVIDLNQVLNAGDTITGSATTNSAVDLIASGVVF